MDFIFNFQISNDFFFQKSCFSLSLSLIPKNLYGEKERAFVQVDGFILSCRILRKYSLFICFGNKASEGAEQLRGLTLSLNTFTISLCNIKIFYKPVLVPQVKSGQKRQKKCIGAEISEKTIQKTELCIL